MVLEQQDKRVSALNLNIDSTWYRVDFLDGAVLKVTITAEGIEKHS